MNAPIDCVLIVSASSSRIVPHFGDADVEERISRALDDLGCAHETVRFKSFRELEGQLRAIGPRTLVLPNATHTERDLSSPFLASALDRERIPYIGSDAIGMASMSKIWTKQILRSHGIETLPGAVYPGPEAIRFIKRASRPLIMKPEFGANSQGVTLVEPLPGAVTIAEELHDSTGQRILIEPWARDREYTVAVIETGTGETIAVPLEICLPEGDSFLSSDVKLHRVAGTHRRVNDPDRHVALCDLANDVFRACGLRDLGRIDVLETGRGEIVVIDVNPHPGFKPGPDRPSYFPDALALEYQWAYEDVILALIAHSAERSGLSLQPGMIQRLASLKGYGPRPRLG